MTLPARWDYEVPHVVYAPTVVDDRVVGYHPEPPFGMTWPHVKTLQHLAALIESKTGARLRVVATEDDDELFEVMTAHSIRAGMPYIAATTYLSAYELGYDEGKRSGETPSTSVDSDDQRPDKEQ